MYSGLNALITRTHDINGIPKKVNVQAFDTILGSVKDILLVNDAHAYDCPHTGAVIIRKVNQAMHITTMENSLLCVMRMRLNDVKIEDCPKFLTENSSRTSHTMIIPSTYNDSVAETLTPL